MMTHARVTWLACGILAIAFNPGVHHLGAQIPSKPASEEIRFWDWTSLDFPAEEYAARRERLLDALAADGGGILIVPGDHGISHGMTFRQLDNFNYLTGLEVPASLLALDADRRSVLLFTSPRDARFENPLRPNDFPGRPLGDDPTLATVSGLTRIVDVGEFEAYLEAWTGEGRLLRVNGGHPGALGALESEALPDWSPQDLLLLHLRRTRPEARTRNAFDAVARVRSILSPAEVERMRRVADLTVRSIRETAGWVAAGVEVLTRELPRRPEELERMVGSR